MPTQVGLRWSPITIIPCPRQQTEPLSKVDFGGIRLPPSPVPDIKKQNARDLRRDGAKYEENTHTHTHTRARSPGDKNRIHADIAVGQLAILVKEFESAAKAMESPGHLGSVTTATFTRLLTFSPSHGLRSQNRFSPDRWRSETAKAHHGEHFSRNKTN